jgi:hypothetical protein
MITDYSVFLEFVINCNLYLLTKSLRITYFFWLIFLYFLV